MVIYLVTLGKKRYLNISITVEHRVKVVIYVWRLEVSMWPHVKREDTGDR